MPTAPTLLIVLVVLGRACVMALAFVAGHLSRQFDSSAGIVMGNVQEQFLRWDALHYLHISSKGYLFEHEYAFMPGIPFILYMADKALSLLSSPPFSHQTLVVHALVSTFVSCDAVSTLYRLTLFHTDSPQIAFLSATLSLLSSSPATLHLAPYAEPWFACLSYRGMLYSAKRQWLLAVSAFALAGCFRSNAVLLSGFIVWGMLIDPFLHNHIIPFSNVILAPVFALLPAIPLLLHQWHAYTAFCTGDVLRPWCYDRLPLIYPFVQSHYWDSGFLRYWSIPQIPNFLLASPVLALLTWGSISFIKGTGLPYLKQAYYHHHSQKSTLQPLLNPSILPHAIHALVLTLTLLLTAHTQIILRLASSMPFTYWSASRLFFELPKYARAWTIWSVVWGAVSIVLWVAFLPPA